MNKSAGARPEWLIEKCWTPRRSATPRSQFARLDVLALLARLREARDEREAARTEQSLALVERDEARVKLACSELVASELGKLNERIIEERTERRRLPDTRESKTTIIRYRHAVPGPTPDAPPADAVLDIYVTVGLYPDGSPGEVFVRVPSDPTISGFLDAAAIAASLALQRGESIQVIAGKWRHQRFPPAGRTDDGAFTSPIDALASRLLAMFPEKEGA